MSTFHWIAFAGVLIISAARFTRLLTFDKFPPTLALRNRYAEWTDKTPRRLKWQRLMFCGYCMGFWVTLALLIWADLAGVIDGAPAFGWTGEQSVKWWWYVNGLFAASYLAAMVMAYDGDNGEDD